MSQKYLQKKANGSIVVTKARADEVKLFLQGKGRKKDKTFTHWVKRRKFQLINYPALGLSSILCTPGTEKVNVTLAKASPADSDILCTQHLMQCSLHTIQVQALYSCLPRAAVDKFVSLCSVCQRMVPQSHREPLKPIIAKGFMQRGQVGGKKDGP